MRLRKRAQIITAVSVLVMGFLLAVHELAAGQKRQAGSPSAAPAGKVKAAATSSQPKAKCKDIPDDARETLELALKNYGEALSVIANNMANAETTGYKKARTAFEDKPYRHAATAGSQDSASEYSPCSRSVGTGCRVAASTIDFKQGRLRHTGGELDLAIEGNGLFQVMDPSGDILYCRAGRFGKNANGNIVIQSADSRRLMEPAIAIPNDATEVSVSPEGVVSVRQPTSTRRTQIGQMQLACFVNPGGLTRKGENLFVESDGAGAPIINNSGQNAMGKVRQGWVEASNVDLDDETCQWRRIQRLCRKIERLLNED